MAEVREENETARLEEDIADLERQLADTAYEVKVLEAAAAYSACPARSPGMGGGGANMASTVPPLERIFRDAPPTASRGASAVAQRERQGDWVCGSIAVLLRHFVSYDLYAFEISEISDPEVLWRAASHTRVPVTDIPELLRELE
jgi:hypothetical protein